MLLDVELAHRVLVPAYLVVEALQQRSGAFERFLVVGALDLVQDVL